LNHQELSFLIYKNYIKIIQENHGIIPYEFSRNIIDFYLKNYPKENKMGGIEDVKQKEGNIN
jgi:hypothetical protein